MKKKITFFLIIQDSAFQLCFKLRNIWNITDHLTEAKRSKFDYCFVAFSGNRVKNWRNLEVTRTLGWKPLISKKRRRILFNLAWQGLLLTARQMVCPLSHKLFGPALNRNKHNLLVQQKKKVQAIKIKETGLLEGIQSDKIECI